MADAAEHKRVPWLRTRPLDEWREQGGGKQVPWSAEEAAALSATKLPGTTNGRSIEDQRKPDDFIGHRKRAELTD